MQDRETNRKNWKGCVKVLNSIVIIDVCCQNGGMCGAWLNRSQYALKFLLVSWVAEHGIYLLDL